MALGEPKQAIINIKGYPIELDYTVHETFVSWTLSNAYYDKPESDRSLEITRSIKTCGIDFFEELLRQHYSEYIAQKLQEKHYQDEYERSLLSAYYDDDGDIPF